MLLCRREKKQDDAYTYFLDMENGKNFYDLVYSATAFHWIPKELGYSMVKSILKSILKSNGTIAL